MQVAPMPPNETARLAAVRRLRVLDTRPEEAIDRVVGLARDVLNVQVAAVSLVDRDRLWFKSLIGAPIAHVPRELAFCGHAILGNDVFVVPDARADERFADNPFVTGEAGIRFYAAAPLLSPDGHAVGTLCILDRTPRILTEMEAHTLRRLGDIAAETLQQRLATLHAEAEGRAKAQFIAGLGYDLRTPLTSILGFADLLSDGTLDDSQRQEFLATIQRNGRQLLSVINDMLDYARIEAGTLLVEQRPFPVADLLIEVERDVRPLAQEKNVAFSVEADARAGSTLFSDPGRARQILATLAASAIRLTDRGPVSLHARPGAEHGHVRFDIVDGGAGLTAEQARCVLQSPGPADSPPARRLAGVALGLRVSQLLARLLKGELGFTPGGGAGGVFSVTLPTFQPGASAAATPPGTVSPEAGPRPLDRARILIVDDHAGHQRHLSMHLRRAGAVVSQANSGSAAIDILTAQGAWPKDPAALPHFDAVVLAMHLPCLDGYATARALREMNHATPIIALGSAGTEADARRCAELGCAEYLARPADPATLIGAIRHLLRLADFTPIAA